MGIVKFSCESQIVIRRLKATTRQKKTFQYVSSLKHKTEKERAAELFEWIEEANNHYCRSFRPYPSFFSLFDF